MILMIQRPINIDQLKLAFPKNKNNAAITGYIPIEFFNEFEKDIRNAMKAYSLKLKVYYRGPRVSNKSSYPRGMRKPGMTRRCDAYYAVVYVRGY